MQNNPCSWFSLETDGHKHWDNYGKYCVRIINWSLRKHGIKFPNAIVIVKPALTRCLIFSLGTDIEKTFQITEL